MSGLTGRQSTLEQRRAGSLNVGRGEMKFRISMFADAFLGSGVPLAGEPITAFENVPVLGLRTGTVLNNSYPSVGDVVKLRFIATNCGQAPLEIVPTPKGGRESNHQPSAGSLTTLLPGESLDYSVFRSWDTPGEQQFTLAYEVRCAGLPFARLAYPTVAIHVRPPQAQKLMPWMLWTRAALLEAQ